MSIAVITGAGSGVGRAIAVKFAAEGWDVALVGRREDALAETGKLAGRASAGRPASFSCDVSDPSSVSTMGEAVLQRFGGVDVLVNSAGINVPKRSFEALSIEDWHAVLATNLHGAYYCVRAFLPAMRQRGAGTIININSDVGKVARDLAGPAYVSSKFGLMGFLQGLAGEVASDGIKVSAVVPGSILTPFGDRSVAEKRAAMVADPGKKYLEPEDVAEVVLFLLRQPHRAWTQELNVWPF